MTKKHIKTLKEDAQYLEEFYVWNKERHPEWDGTYVLELVEEKRSIAETRFSHSVLDILFCRPSAAACICQSVKDGIFFDKVSSSVNVL